jgi:hypothetical protein
MFVYYPLVIVLSHETLTIAMCVVKVPSMICISEFIVVLMHTKLVIQSCNVHSYKSLHWHDNRSILFIIYSI